MRHKRQALQDMARPLKQWLYKHRDNPYPTKTEKILLALGSQMTLVQVIQTPQTGGLISRPAAEEQKASASAVVPFARKDVAQHSEAGPDTLASVSEEDGI